METKKYRILSIDGGGIRGIIPGQILSHIETHLGKRVGEHFDMIAGTSTGGILTCAFLCPDPRDPGKPKYTAEQIVDLYFRFGGNIFKAPLFHKIRTLWGFLDETYPANGLEKTLQEYFGETMLCDLIKPTLITAYDTDNRKAVFFTQHDAVKNPAKNFKVKEIARGTSAAPTYFECARVPSDPRQQEFMTLVDGGVFANNPGLCAYAEARTLFPKPGKKRKADQEMATAIDLAILSLGTGFGETSYPYVRAKRWGKAQWIIPVIDIMMSGVSETVDYQLDQIFKSVNASGQYLRINGRMPENVSPDMDNIDKKNLMALKEFGNDLYFRYEQDIKGFLEI
jgi:patatin-like phospholipase/acyl hydrolase